MLNLQINDIELEQYLKNTYGNNTQSITEAFTQFVKFQKIKRDVVISKEQAKNDQVIGLDKAIDDICEKYE
jgi:acyl-CoA hydrolase